MSYYFLQYPLFKNDRNLLNTLAQMDTKLKKKLI